ncbi:hypothetical protein LTR27_005088 [Elasticomyces elasticus]|nr:hypothetical protein LTR27_005088 [Elasticomyces elasticus]
MLHPLFNHNNQHPTSKQASSEQHKSSQSIATDTIKPTNATYRRQGPEKMIDLPMLSQLVMYFLITTPLALGLPVIYLTLFTFVMLWHAIFPTTTPRGPTLQHRLVQAEICMELIAPAMSVLRAFVQYNRSTSTISLALNLIWLAFRLKRLLRTWNVIQVLALGILPPDWWTQASRSMAADSFWFILSGIFLALDMRLLHSACRDEAMLWGNGNALLEATTEAGQQLTPLLKASVWMRQWLWNI